MNGCKSTADIDICNTNFTLGSKQNKIAIKGSSSLTMEVDI